MRRQVLVAAALVCLAASTGWGCAERSREPASWAAVNEGALTPDQVRQRDAALEARKAMYTELTVHLGQALERGGPAAAITVCRDEAPAIARRISERHGLAIGRTSFWLRNPENAPPDWARPLVEARADSSVWLAGPEGRLGAFLPIRVQRVCMTCHGPEDTLDPAVRTALARHYPEDDATGFGVGDLRGWFWVEVPGGL